MKQVIKVLVADDFDLIRQGVKRIIDYEQDISVIAEAKNGQEVLVMVEACQPDVLLLDMNMPIMDGMEALRFIRKDNQKVKIIMLTVEDNQTVIKEAIKIGADGYILKDTVSQEVVKAIHTVMAGGKVIDQSLVATLFSGISNEKKVPEDNFDTLSNREIEIIYFISRGMSNKEISQELFITEKTVKNCISRIFKKIDVTDRLKATLAALDHDIEKYYERVKEKENAKN